MLKILILLLIVRIIGGLPAQHFVFSK